MRTGLIAGALALGILTLPALAQEPQEQQETAPPGELALEGVEKLMRALNALIEMIPQYEMPTIDENGDIIIRRKQGPEGAPEPDAPEEQDDQTST